MGKHVCIALAAPCFVHVLVLYALEGLLTPVLSRTLPNAQVQYKNVTFTVWDVGGQEKLRPLW